jgi:hypothetical protein
MLSENFPKMENIVKASPSKKMSGETTIPISGFVALWNRPQYHPISFHNTIALKHVQNAPNNAPHSPHFHSIRSSLGLSKVASS